jgi:hypothetical protein
MDACALALSEFPPVPDVLHERDACAMIRRCHRFQHPHECGGREGVVVWTPELIVMVAERPGCDASEPGVEPE